MLIHATVTVLRMWRVSDAMRVAVAADGAGSNGSEGGEGGMRLACVGVDLRDCRRLNSVELSARADLDRTSLKCH
eukprot:1261667-Pleurochrysis_carterae.AAC.1